MDLPTLIDVFVHEIKSPLTTINLFSEIITGNPDKSTSIGPKIGHSVDHITRTTNYLRDIFKIINHDFSPTLSQITFADLWISYSQSPSHVKLNISQNLPSVSLNLNSDLFAQIIGIVLDRLQYYHPDAPLYLDFKQTSKFLTLSFSTSTHPPFPTPKNQIKLLNPNTSIYYLATLITFLGGKYSFFKSDDNTSFVLSLPLGD